MKVFICADMEGVTGVVHRDQLMPEGHAWPQARRWMTGDINAAIEGVLREAPDATFVVNDGHAIMRNVLLEDLHERAELVMGPATFENKPLCQTTGIDATFDLFLLVGHHTRAGTPGGLLSHTWSGRVITNLWLNGTIVGEIAMNSAVAGAFGVPVGLVTGTDRLMDEARETLPGDPALVAVKRTLGPTAAVCKTPAVTRRLIADGGAEAVRRLRAGTLRPLVAPGPVTVEIETYRREMTDQALRSSFATRIDDRRFRTEGADAAEALERAWQAVVRAHDEVQGWLA
jgi:D-amino peptidase